MNYKEDKTYKRLVRNFKLHLLCNLAVGIIVVYAFIAEGIGILIGWALIMLGICLIATGITCSCIAKRIEYLKKTGDKIYE